MINFPQGTLSTKGNTRKENNIMSTPDTFETLVGSILTQKDIASILNYMEQYGQYSPETRDSLPTERFSKPRNTIHTANFNLPDGTQVTLQFTVTNPAEDETTLHFVVKNSGGETLHKKNFDWSASN